MAPSLDDRSSILWSYVGSSVFTIRRLWLWAPRQQDSARWSNATGWDPHRVSVEVHGMEEVKGSIPFSSTPNPQVTGLGRSRPTV